MISSVDIEGIELVKNSVKATSHCSSHCRNCCLSSSTGLLCGDEGVEGDWYPYVNLDTLVQQCNSVACAWLRLEIREMLGIGNSRERLMIVVAFNVLRPIV